MNITDKQSQALMRLAKNTGDYRELINILEQALSEKRASFNKSAIGTVFNPDARPKALSLSGEVDCLSDIISMLEEQS